MSLDLSPKNKSFYEDLIKLIKENLKKGYIVDLSKTTQTTLRALNSETYRLSVLIRIETPKDKKKAKLLELVKQTHTKLNEE